MHHLIMLEANVLYMQAHRSAAAFTLYSLPIRLLAVDIKRKQQP